MRDTDGASAKASGRSRSKAKNRGEDVTLTNEDLEMDYYAASPTWKMPKWLGAVLGGIFSLIVILCVGLIMQLTRPAHHAAAQIARTAPTGTQRATAIEAARPAKAEAPTPAQPNAAVVQRTHEASHTRRRPIFAKHDPKTTRPPKSDLDRLLGL